MSTGKRNGEKETPAYYSRFIAITRFIKLRSVKRSKKNKPIVVGYLGTEKEISDGIESALFI